MLIEVLEPSENVVTLDAELFKMDWVAGVTFSDKEYTKAMKIKMQFVHR